MKSMRFGGEETMPKKLVDPNGLCMGCMKELVDSSGPCPHCGFWKAGYRKPANSIPLYEILKGKYLVGKVLGVGGFGITYVGWDFYQGRRVCIKEYFPRGIASRDTSWNPSYSVSAQTGESVTHSMHVMTQTNAIARNAYIGGLQAYIKEAELLSKFYRMPGIVSVRDFFYGNGTAYIVMEYIEGTDLRQLARANGKRLAPGILLPMLKDVIRALYAVHQAGIIHRDISPDNIMVTPQLQAKVVDFGAAKSQGTMDGTVFLKHGYAPPEQYDSSGDQGPWTDVYSLCAAIYCLLSGKKLQKAHDRMEKDQTESLRSLGIPVTEWEERAIQRGLSLTVKDRHPSMAELYQDLYREAI